MARNRYSVRVTIDAEADLEEIVEYIEDRDSPEQADRVFAGLAKAIQALDTTPTRGRIVPELREVGVSEYREVRWKPYRIMYGFLGKHEVHVVAILDGRRDLEDLLARRLLR